MKLRRESWIARAYFWSLRFDGLLGHAREEAGSNLCAVVRRVFVWMPIEFALMAFTASAAIGAVVMLHVLMGWAIVLVVYGSVLIFLFGLVGAPLIAKAVLPKRRARHGSFSALAEWWRAKKRRYCPHVEFTKRSAP